MMRFRRLFSSIVAISVSSAGGAFAQAPAAKADKPAPAMPQALRTPAPELDTLTKPYEGEWKCDTNYPADAWGPGKPATTAKVTMKVSKEMGGLWYRGEYEVEKTKFVLPLRAVFVIGYDTTAKSSIMMRYDNTGTVSLQTAPGATAEKQVFVGEANVAGKKVKVRDTMTRRGPKQFEHTFEMDTGKGLQLMSTDACTK